MFIIIVSSHFYRKEMPPFSKTTTTNGTVNAKVDVNESHLAKDWSSYSLTHHHLWLKGRVMCWNEQYNKVLRALPCILSQLQRSLQALQDGDANTAATSFGKNTITKDPQHSRKLGDEQYLLLPMTSQKIVSTQAALKWWEVGTQASSWKWPSTMPLPHAPVHLNIGNLPYILPPNSNKLSVLFTKY